MDAWCDKDRLLPRHLGCYRAEQPFPQADRTVSTSHQEQSGHSSNQEGQSRVTTECSAPIATRLLWSRQSNGPRGLEGRVSKPQIPCRVDWFVSCQQIASCGSETPRTTSIDTPTNRRLKHDDDRMIVVVRMIFVVVFSQKNLLTLRQDEPDPDVGILSQKRRFSRTIIELNINPSFLIKWSWFLKPKISRQTMSGSLN